VKSTTVARNYAEALVLAAEASGGTRAIERFGEVLDAVSGAVRADDRIAVALESPRVSKAAKADLLARGLADAAPPEVIRFLQAVVRRGRQGLLAEISSEYQSLVDVKLNRVHAGVTVAKPVDEKLQQEIVTRLQRALAKDVRPHFRTDPAILGGVVVRVGDRVYDGSVRRRLNELRRRLLAAQ